MRNFLGILFIALICGLFNGCGESFRKPLVYGTPRGDSQALFDSQGNRFTYMRWDQDQWILNTYANELSGMEENTQTLGDSIDAVDLILGRDDRGPFIRVRILAGNCSQQLNFVVDAVPAQLERMQVIKLGRQGDYEAEVRCTDNSCEEMVAAIRKRRSPRRGLVLVGLGLTAHTDSHILYTSRVVRYQPYFIDVPGVDNFAQNNSCNFNNDGIGRFLGEGPAEFSIFEEEGARNLLEFFIETGLEALFR